MLLGALLPGLAGGLVVAGPLVEPAGRRVARVAGKTPAERVAAIETWREAQGAEVFRRRVPPASFEKRRAELQSRPVPPRPADARGGLAWEVRQGWIETLAQARNQVEAVALTDEFRRLNAEALGELRRPQPTAEERRARLLQTAARLPASPEDPQVAITKVLAEIRAEARTPAETVGRIDAFLRLNAEALTDAHSKSHPRQTAR